MISLVLAALLAVAAVVYVLRPLFRSARTGGQEAPDSRRESLTREKEGVYLAIRELEFDHLTGVVSDEDFNRLMPRYRAHAVGLIEAIDQLGEEAGAAPAATVCQACGSPNTTGHRFCTGCGREVAMPPSPPDGAVSDEAAG